MNDLLADQNRQLRQLRQEVANLRLELEAARAALAAERDAHQVTMLNLESARNEADLRITTVTYQELREMWHESDLIEEMHLHEAQERDEARARGNWEEPTRRERPIVSERPTVRVKPETMAQIVFGVHRG